MPLTLTSRDEELLEVLARRVRFLSVEQVARVWWSQARNAVELAGARIEALEEARLLTAVRLLAAPEQPLELPIAAWRSGEGRPNFDALAYRLSTRWHEPARLTPCVVATQEARSRFGGPRGRQVRRTEVTHDLHLAQVYLRMRTDDPVRAATWRFEEEIYEARGRAGRREKLPDALVTDPEGDTAIELAGVYGAEKLRGFHAYCEAKGLAYELW